MHLSGVQFCGGHGLFCFLLSGFMSHVFQLVSQVALMFSEGAIRLARFSQSDPTIFGSGPVSVVFGRGVQLACSVFAE